MLGALGGAALVGCGGAARRPPDRRRGLDPPRTLWRPVGESRGTVLLVHGLGTRPAIWDLPGSGGLGPTLARAGFTVIAPDLSGRPDPGGWRAAIEAICAGLERPPLGVGLDLGGTALFGARASFAGRVGVGAPLASGGFSAAMRGVLTAPGAPTWRDLGRRTVGGRSVVRLVLTDGLPARIHRPLVRQALAPMPLTLRRAWYGPGAASPVPSLLSGGSGWGLPAPGAGWGPTLVVAAPGDGLAPPWQCDPRAFGHRWPGLTLRAPSRVNGDEREFNHLDLVVHPDARRRVWPSIVGWLEERTLEARRASPGAGG